MYFNNSEGKIIKFGRMIKIIGSLWTSSWQWHPCFEASSHTKSLESTCVFLFMWCWSLFL